MVFHALFYRLTHRLSNRLPVARPIVQSMGYSEAHLMFRAFDRHLGRPDIPKADVSSHLTDIPIGRPMDITYLCDIPRH